MIGAKREAGTGDSPAVTVSAQWSELAHRELVSRIVVSPTFARSERLSALLTYVCDMTFKGRESEINEQKIGHAVFGRSRDYDSAIDGIVRTQASRLRQRLDRYFQQEGCNEPVRIVIPRGGYVPIFEPQPKAAVVSNHEEPPPVISIAVNPVEKQEAASASEGYSLWRWLPWALCSMLAIVVVILAVRDRHSLQALNVGISPTHPLWSRIFVIDHTTLAVPADSGLVLFHNMTGKAIGLDDYLQGGYRVQPTGSPVPVPEAPAKAWLANLASRRYTSIVDLNAILSLAQRAHALQSDLQVRYARDTRPNDLKTGNVILLGASEANPWVGLFERNMNFVFHNNYQTNVFSVLNRSPQNGEPKQWDSAWNDPQRRVYGLVAYLPNLAGDGNALIIEGTSMSGTEGAWDFVADDSQLLPFLKRIQRPDGTLPHFELLLGTQNMNASAVQSTLLAWRITN
jgi:hypothetical protein